MRSTRCAGWSAISCGSSARTIRKSSFARHNPATWQARAGAAAAFERLLADENRILGTNHPDTQETVRAIRDLAGHAEEAVG